MAEACTVSHAESRRSLPAWMLKACSGNVVVKTEDQDEKASELDEQTRNLEQTKPIRRNTGRRSKNVDSEGAGELGVLLQCEGREKGKRMSKNAVKDEIEEIEEVASKNPRKVSTRAATKTGRKQKLDNVKSEASSPGASDDDIELTVEDLVSIAEEYINADKQKQHEPQTMKTARRKERLLCPKVSTDADAGGSVVNAQSMKGLVQCTTVTRNTRLIEHRGDECKSYQGPQCPSSLETTDDVAQDMLNLFLGHLLSKPADYGKRSEYIESITANANHLPEKKDVGYAKKSETMESITTTLNHVTEKKDWRRDVPRLGEPVTKKKSSLKDKVALLF